MSATKAANCNATGNQEALEQAGAHGMTFIWFDEEMPEYHFKENRSRLDDDFDFEARRREKGGSNGSWPAW